VFGKYEQLKSRIHAWLSNSINFSISTYASMWSLAHSRRFNAKLDVNSLFSRVVTTNIWEGWSFLPITIRQLFWWGKSGIFSCILAAIFLSSVSFILGFVLLSECHGWSAGAHLRLLAPLVTRLLSHWMLHWWRVNGSTARGTLPCTHPSTPSTRLGRPQVPFFKSSVWPRRESNQAYHCQCHGKFVILACSQKSFHL